MRKPLKTKIIVPIVISLSLIIGIICYVASSRNLKPSPKEATINPEILSSKLIAIDTMGFFKEPYEKDWLSSSDLECRDGECISSQSHRKPTVGFLGWSALAYASMNKISHDLKWQEYAEIAVNHLYNNFGPRKYTVSSRFSLGHNITQLDYLKTVFTPKDNKINELIFLGGNDLTYRMSNESSSIYPAGYVPMIVAVAARNLAHFAIFLDKLEDKDSIIAFAQKYSPELLIKVNTTQDLNELKSLALSSSKKLIEQLFSDPSLKNDYCWAFLAEYESAVAEHDNVRINRIGFEFEKLNITDPDNSKITFNHLPTVLSCLELTNVLCTSNSSLCNERNYLADMLVNNFLDYWKERTCSDGSPGFLSLNQSYDCSGQAKTYSNNAHAVYLLSNFYREFEK